MLRPGMVLDSLRLVDSAFLVEAGVGRGSIPNEILLSPTEIRLEIPDTFVRPRKKEKKNMVYSAWMERASGGLLF